MAWTWDNQWRKVCDVGDCVKSAESYVEWDRDESTLHLCSHHLHDLERQGARFAVVSDPPPEEVSEHS